MEYPELDVSAVPAEDVSFNATALGCLPNQAGSVQVGMVMFEGKLAYGAPRSGRKHFEMQAGERGIVVWTGTSAPVHVSFPLTQLFIVDIAKFDEARAWPVPVMGVTPPTFTRLLSQVASEFTNYCNALPPRYLQIRNHTYRSRILLCVGLATRYSFDGHAPAYVPLEHLGFAGQVDEGTVNDTTSSTYCGVPGLGIVNMEHAGFCLTGPGGVDGDDCDGGAATEIINFKLPESHLRRLRELLGDSPLRDVRKSSFIAVRRTGMHVVVYFIALLVYYRSEHADSSYLLVISIATTSSPPWFGIVSIPSA